MLLIEAGKLAGLLPVAPSAEFSELVKVKTIWLADVGIFQKVGNLPWEQIGGPLDFTIFNCAAEPAAD